MSALISILVVAALSSAPERALPMQANQWFSIDLYHLERTLPAFDGLLDVPIHPGLQLGYHRNLFGKRSFGAGVSAQTAFQSFDELFWSLSGGGGMEGSFRSSWGLFSALGFRLDYARAFTGQNNFVSEGGRYKQQSDTGRGFLRMTLVDFALGYSPAPLRRYGVVPALRFAWLLETPLYENDGANPWSYTAFGLTVLWMWEGRP